MLAVSSPLFSVSPHGWPLMDDDPIPIHDQSFLFPVKPSQSFQFPPFPPLPPQPDLDSYHYSTPSPEGGSADEPKTVKSAKKLSHNASERDRRKKMNCLYSSLRSLLPSMDQTKKLSNPATISRILSYIPELQRQVEELQRKREELLSAMAGEEAQIREEKKTRTAALSSSSVVSASKLNEREMAVQISGDIGRRNSLSEILCCFEEEGLLMLNGSSFESLDGKVFHNLHFQMEINCRKGPEMLSNKLLQMLK